MSDPAHFDLGFSPDAPTPAQVESVTNRLAILKGQRAGIESVGRNAAQQALNPAIDAADQIVGAAIEPANDLLGHAQQVQAAITAAGQQAALNALQSPLRTAIGLGYQPLNSSLLIAPKQSKRQRRRNGAAPTVAGSAEPALPQPGNLAQSPAEPQFSLPGGGATPLTKPLSPAPAFGPPVPVGYQLTDFGPSGTSPGECGPIPKLGTGVVVGQTFQALGPDGLCHLYAYEAAMPLPPAPGGGGVPPIPAPPKPPGGGVPPIPAPPKPPGGGVPPLPPAPPPCPPATVNVNCPPCPPPNILVLVPPCPQCGAPGQVMPLPLPQLPPNISVNVPAPIINVDLPPCQNCGNQPLPVPVQPPPIAPPSQPLPPISVNVPISLSPPSPGGATTPTAPAPSPPPPAPSLPCETCSIAWLSLHYPLFVLASRAAQKTDYDILVDAISQKLCCGTIEMPGCSIPFLQRMVPEFVSAGKAQGLTDDELLQQAVNIGLCKDEPVSTGLGEQNVGLIAPGSAAEIEAEFDPPSSGEARRLQGQRPINSDGTDFCWQAWVLPGPETGFRQSGLENLDCITGWQRAAWGVVQGIEKALSDGCNCDEKSGFAKVGVALNQIWNTQTWWGKAVYYAGHSFLWLARELACNTVQIENWFNALSGCQQEGGGAALLGGLVLGAWKRWIGDIPDPLWEGVQQLMGLACPHGLPNPAEANDLRATGFIDSTDWECFHRAAGNIPDYQTPLFQARQRRPDDDKLWLRYRQLGAWLRTGERDGKKLTQPEIDAIKKEQSQIEDIYRHNGWTNPDWFGIYQNTQAATPTPQDAIEWMIKDVNDQQIQQTFLLDAEFNQKYGGRVQQLFEINGVRKEDAENYWRAHWQNISPERLFHMHKRLRPGWTKLMSDAEVLQYVEAICPRKTPQVTAEILASRPESNGFPVPTYCDEVADAETAREYLESIVVTGYHASEALGQDDFPAFWRPRLLALSYNVLTRVDARRAYEIGQFDDEKLTAVYEDQGYKHSDAVTLTKFARAQLVQKFARSPTAKQWMIYPYPVDLLFEVLQADGMRDDLWDDVFHIISLKRTVYVSIQQIKEVEQGVKKGRMTEAQARDKLLMILKGA